MSIIDKAFDNVLESNSTHDIFASIRALDIGIANHEAWFSRINQSLVCDTPHSNADDLCEDAHCRCKFGQWFYSADTDALKAIDTFRAVDEKHQLLHMHARKILLKSENNQKISKEEYNDFTSQITAFKLDVRHLQYQLMTKVCVVDHLTGAWNRYAMYSNLQQEKERLERFGNSCAICMMDIDHFKQVNDNYDHRTGDLVLKAVTDFCRASLRKYDSIYRYGGEEFIFSMPDAEQGLVKVVIERLRATLAKHPITLPTGESIFVTASFGVANLAKDIPIEDSIQAADHALLYAKTDGRNRVCFWDDDLNAE